MQVDCYNRNFNTVICTVKCKFFEECSRNFCKDMKAANDLKAKLEVEEIKRKMREGAFK